MGVPLPCTASIDNGGAVRQAELLLVRDEGMEPVQKQYVFTGGGTSLDVDTR